MKKQGQKATSEQTDKIDDQKFARAKPTDDHIGKKIQGEHIEEEMGNIHMKEPRCGHPFPLPCLYAPDAELISIKKNGIVEPPKGNQHIGSNDGNGGNM